MGELNHRVRNVLATVQAIANQSFGGGEPDRFKLFSARLRALTRAHDLLIQRSWEGASLASVVDGVAAAFSHERFDIEGPDLHLPPRAVITLSLALHELATHAAKYGALSVPSGNVSIHWACSAETATFKLSWQERGGPTVSTPTETAFGSILITNALAAELNGEVELQYPPAGTVCQVRAPLDASWD